MSDLLLIQCSMLQRHYMPTFAASELHRRTKYPAGAKDLHLCNSDIQSKLSADSSRAPHAFLEGKRHRMHGKTSDHVCSVHAESMLTRMIQCAESQLHQSWVAVPSLQGGKQLTHKHRRPQSMSRKTGSSCCSSHGQYRAESRVSAKRRCPPSNRYRAASPLRSPMATVVIRIAQASE